jgi:hypothetical protein
MDSSLLNSLNEIMRWWPVILIIDLIISVLCEVAAQWFFDIYHSLHQKKHLVWGSIFRISRVLNTWIICVLMLRVLTYGHI